MVLFVWPGNIVEINLGSTERETPDWPVLFHRHINNLHAGVECTIINFAAATKVGDAVDFLQGKKALQRDFHSSKHWRIINGIKWGEEQLESSPVESDVGGAGWQQAQDMSAVIPDSQKGKSHPKVHQTQCHLAVKIDNYPSVFLLMQPDFDCCVWLWIPQLKKDVKVLECV